MGGDNGGGALNTPSASRSAKFCNRRRGARSASSICAGVLPPAAPPAVPLDDAPGCPGCGTDTLMPSSSQSGIEARIASRCGSC